MVIDTGQIKAEEGGKRNKKRTKIQEYFRIAIEIVKLCLLTFRPDDLAGMPLSQLYLATTPRT